MCVLLSLWGRFLFAVVAGTRFFSLVFRFLSLQWHVFVFCSRCGLQNVFFFAVVALPRRVVVVVVVVVVVAVVQVEIALSSVH